MFMGSERISLYLILKQQIIRIVFLRFAGLGRLRLLPAVVVGVMLAGCDDDDNGFAAQPQTFQ
jgi:hypothetical protein